MARRLRHAAAFACVLAALAGADFLQAAEQAAAPARGPYLDETARDAIDSVVIVPGASPGEQEITGTYEKVTPGLYGGAAAGSRVGNPSTQVGPVTVGIPIPILTLPGMIAGGIAGATQREIQEFRDALAEELADASKQPINNDKLARYVYQTLRLLPALDTGLFAPTTPVPDDADAVMFVDIAGMTIDVDGTDAVLTTAGHLRLERRSDGGKLYEHTAHYQDRAPLERWTEDGNRLIEDYANFALHYLGRELAAASLAGTQASHAVQPVESETLDLERKDAWQGTSRRLQPTLGWAFAEESVAATAWDVEVYDAHRLVYQQRQVPAASHTLTQPLEPCGEYRWSVRPHFDSNGAVRFGEWMRRPATGEAAAVDGLAGRDAGAAPAYIQDFATLRIHCKAS